MRETSARLLRLLSHLQARSFWSGAELAERLEVSERTVRRDVDRLRSLGHPVSSSAGVAGGYQLGAGRSLPPLLLEDDEALAVAMGLRMAAAGTVTGMAEAAVRALTKLDQVLPARLRRRVHTLHEAVSPLAFGGPSVDPEMLMALASGCRNEEVLSFGYCDAEGRARDRSVEPHALVHAAARWYLVAWDRDREDWRTFRVDRIAEGRIRPGRRFVRRPIPGGDAGRYVSRSVALDVYPHRARIILHAPMSELASRVHPLAGRLTSIDATTCRIEAGARSLSTLAAHIAVLGVDFEIEEPTELVDEMRALIRRLRRATTPRPSRGPGRPGPRRPDLPRSRP